MIDIKNRHHCTRVKPNSAQPFSTVPEGVDLTVIFAHRLVTRRVSSRLSSLLLVTQSISNSNSRERSFPRRPFHQTVPYSSQYVICSISFVIYHLWYIICSISFVVYQLQYIIFGISFVAFHLLYINCSISFVVYHSWYIICRISFQYIISTYRHCLSTYSYSRRFKLQYVVMQTDHFWMRRQCVVTLSR